jgi:hypothetical protein
MASAPLDFREQLNQQGRAIEVLAKQLEAALQTSEGPAPRGRQSARARETTRLKTVLSGLGSRVTNPFVFTVALDQVQRAAANQPQSPLS